MPAFESREQERRAARFNQERTRRGMWVAAVVVAIIAFGAWRSERRDRQNEAAIHSGSPSQPYGSAAAAPPVQVEISVSKLPPPEPVSGPTDESKQSRAERDALSTALEPYRKNDYSGSVESLIPLTQKHPLDGEAQLYLGVSELMLWHNKDAAETLSTASGLLQGQRRQTAQWYRAIALLRTGSPGADAAFASLCKQGGEPYGKPSCEIAQQMPAPLAK